MKVKVKYVGVIEIEVEIPEELNPNILEETYSMFEYIIENDLIPQEDYCLNTTLGTIVEYQINGKIYETQKGLKNENNKN